MQGNLDILQKWNRVNTNAVSSWCPGLQLNLAPPEYKSCLSQLHNKVYNAKPIFTASAM